MEAMMWRDQKQNLGDHVSSPRKVSRHIDINSKKDNEEVEKEENEEDVEQVADGDGDDAQSEDDKQVSLL